MIDSGPPLSEMGVSINPSSTTKTPFATLEKDAGGLRVVAHAKYDYSHPPTYKAPVNETPLNQLLYSPEETAQKIEELREIVASDDYINQLRTYFLQQTGYPLDNIDGEPYIRLYRGLAPGWEEATVAAGLSDRTGNSSQQLRYQKEMETWINYYKQKKIDGQKLSQELLRAHMIDSTYSMFVPASISVDYAKNVHPDTHKVIEIVVPLKYVVPISQARHEWNWGHKGFDNEQEVAIAGKIEPEWVRYVKTESTKGTPDEVRREEIQS